MGKHSKAAKKKSLKKRRMRRKLCAKSTVALPALASDKATNSLAGQAVVSDALSSQCEKQSSLPVEPSIIGQR